MTSPIVEDNSQNLKIGDEIGLSFKIPPVVNSKYGSSSQLCGVIPFVHPYGELGVPATRADPRFESFIREKAQEFAFCFPDDLDDEIIKKMRDYITYGASMVPRHNLINPGYDSYITFTIGAFVADDAFDALAGDSGHFKYSDMQKMTELVQNIFTGFYKGEDELSCPLEALVPFKKIQWRIYEQASAEVPDFAKRNKYFLYETLNCVRASLLLKETNPDGRVKTAFSTRTTRGLKAYDSGFLASQEYYALHGNITVGEEVRQDLLFQQTMSAYNIASSALNDVIGLGRDIKNEDDNESNILTNVVTLGISLQQAFEDGLKYLVDAIQDFKTSAKLLKEVYVDDPNVSKFTELMADSIDGAMYGYTQSRRYGPTVYKTVSM